MHRWLLAGFVALAMLLTACGGGDDETSTKSDKSHKNDDTEESSDSGSNQAPAGGDKTGDEATTGDDGATTGSGSRDDYVAAAAAQAGDGEDAAEVSCLTSAYIDAIGVDRLNQVTSPEKIEQEGLPSPSDLGIELTKAEGNTFYDSMSKCVDVRAFFLGSFGDQAVTDCLNQKVDDATLKAYVVALFTMTSPEGEDPAITGLQTAMTECQQLAMPTSG